MPVRRWLADILGLGRVAELMDGFAGYKTAPEQVTSGPNSTVLNRRSSSAIESSRASLDLEVMRKLVEHDVSDLAA